MSLNKFEYKWTSKYSQKEITAIQEEMDLGQMQDFIGLLTDLDLPVDPANPIKSLGNLTVNDLLKVLSKKEAMVKFIRIILFFNSNAADKDKSSLPYPILKKVLSDFLSCNSELAADLSLLFNSTVLKNLFPEKAGSSQSPKSSTSSVMETSGGNKKLIK